MVRMEHAFGLGATQACGLMAAQFGAMSKRMHHGIAARNGLYAALLARGGYTGIEGVFEQPYGGYLSTFGEGHNPDVTQITDELGERWETERIVVPEPQPLQVPKPEQVPDTTPVGARGSRD